ncbi:alpha/beta fold hydrolase [Methylobacterium sp. NFXW15]|uniref:alpha/beta fold hydrolase n=1 Tax=Methylobacterium sp. NFXW15 TaxID=2819512 RepID=UPI003CF33766
METGGTFDLTLGGRRVCVPYDLYGHGPGALLLPALSTISSRREVAGLAGELASDHRCLVPDWPGFGAQPRQRVPLEPATFHAFLDALLQAAPGPYALGVAAGHAAGYLVAAARRHPHAFGRLVLVAPTWRGPLPTAMPQKAAWFPRIRAAVEAPLIGEALYRINISPPIIGRMMRAHVYGDPQTVTPDLVRAKHAITRQRNGRFGTAAFVTGGLDPVASREAFLALFGPDLPPVLMLRPDGAPRRSGAEMDALAASGLVAARPVPGALSPHEEHPGAIAAVIRGA